MKTTKKKVEDKKVKPAETEVKVEEKKVEKKVEDKKVKPEGKKVKIKHILYAVDSAKFDKEIFKNSERKNTRVTVLIKTKYSKASVSKYLKSNKIRIATAFKIKFAEEKFDIGFIEKEMLSYIPKIIIKQLKNKVGD